jgi:hypothetical protein
VFLEKSFAPLSIESTFNLEPDGPKSYMIGFSHDFDQDTGFRPAHFLFCSNVRRGKGDGFRSEGNIVHPRGAVDARVVPFLPVS